MEDGANDVGNRIVIGIDPGLAGGIAILDGDAAEAHVMPTLKDPRGRGRIIDTRRLLEMIEANIKEDQGLPHVFVETQRPMLGQGVRSMFTIGKGVGILEGLCSALHVPFEFLQPRRWQTAMFAGLPHKDTKAAAIKRASEPFPRVSLLATARCTKLHHGLADARLIATFGRRMLGTIDAAGGV